MAKRKDEDKGWYDKLTDEHFLEVGRAVTAWGELEMLVYAYLQEYISPKYLYEFLAKQMRGFDGRCDLLLNFVTAKVGKEERVKSLVKWLEKAKKLGQQRNLLAHNPMQFWIHDSEVKGGIVHSRSGEEVGLDLAAVRNFTETTKAVRFGIMTAMINASNPNT